MVFTYNKIPSRNRNLFKNRLNSKFSLCKFLKTIKLKYNLKKLIIRTVTKKARKTSNSAVPYLDGLRA